MLNMVRPKISCVMVTLGRVEHVRNSVRCFIEQTYPNKELVVLSQGNAEENKKIEECLRSVPDKVHFFPAPLDLTLGAMRNTSIEISTGNIICQWDDDDLYHPDRLATQYKVLRSDSRRIASFYCDFLKYFANSGELYWCDWSGEPMTTHKYLCGTVMFYKEAFGQYCIFYPQNGAQCRVEEDLNVLEKLVVKGDIGPVFAGHQYIYVYHGTNTYDLDHHRLTLNTTWGKKVLGVEDLLARQELLVDSLHKSGIRKPVIIRSNDGIAFTYEPK
jgi:glycosyltransferase involved in cell wall biosynthesis